MTGGGGGVVLIITVCCGGGGGVTTTSVVVIAGRGAIRLRLAPTRFMISVASLTPLLPQ